MPNPAQTVLIPAQNHYIYKEWNELPPEATTACVCGLTLRRFCTVVVPTGNNNAQHPLHIYVKGLQKKHQFISSLPPPPTPHLHRWLRSRCPEQATVTVMC